VVSGNRGGDGKSKLQWTGHPGLGRPRLVCVEALAASIYVVGFGA
jgi:hypothetical protein